MNMNRRTEDITGGLLPMTPLSKYIHAQLATKGFIEPETLTPYADRLQSLEGLIGFSVANHANILELFRRLPSRTVLDDKVLLAVGKKVRAEQTHLQEQREAAIQAYGEMRSLLVQIHQAQERLDASIDELRRCQSNIGR